MMPVIDIWPWRFYYVISARTSCQIDIKELGLDTVHRGPETLKRKPFSDCDHFWSWECWLIVVLGR